MVRKKKSRKKWAGKKIIVGKKKTRFFFCPFGFRHGNPWMKKKILRNLIEKIKIIVANLFLNQFSSYKQRKLFISENGSGSTAPDTCSV